MDYNYFWISFLLTCISAARAEFIFHIHEEVPNGTVVASGAVLSTLQVEFSPSNPDGVPIIVNRNAPGASNFAFLRRNPIHSGDSSGGFTDLALIVSGRVDRETICPTTGRTSDQQQTHTNFKLFHIGDPSSHAQHMRGNFQSRFLYQPASPSGTLNVDCWVTLRVASGDKIFHVKIEILDINDSSPSWGVTEYRVFLRDGDPAGTTVSLPLAEDADSGMNGELTYSLQIDDYGYSAAKDDFRRHALLNWFELVKDIEGMGQKLLLRTKTVIDREQSPETVPLLLVARDAASSAPKTGKLRIVINITDVNDNAPMFERPIYKLDILPEDTPVGKKLLQLQAQDMDVGANAELFYRFKDNGQPIMELIEYFFELTRDGQLKVRNRLNVDENADGQKHLPSSPISFGVEAVDGADAAYALTGSTTIQLQVSDTNDEAPRIQVYPIRPPSPGNVEQKRNAIETTAQENGNTEQMLALVEISDPDLDGLDSVECHLKSSSGRDFFQLSLQSNTKGEYSLMTNVVLDREHAPRLEVTIQCRDSADHVTRQDVGVNLLDLNDNPPQFEKLVYDFFIVEDDAEMPAPIESKKRLLRDAAGETGVRAKDMDIGANANVTYKVEMDPNEQTSASYFEIDPVKGTLYATAPLDRETASLHHFIVSATDQGEVALTATATVNVHVQDLNDNAPQFDEKSVGDGGYSFSISENLAPGALVGRVTAFDRDDDQPGSRSTQVIPNHRSAYSLPRLAERSPSKLIYSMGREKDAAYFRIDKNTGELTTRRQLDREAQSSYVFQVLVSDGMAAFASSSQNVAGQTTRMGNDGTRWDAGKRKVHTASTSVVVTVIDDNDNSPTFVQPNATNHLILLDPTTIPGRSLLEIQATDPDEGENGRVTYSIFEGNLDGIFNVDPVTGLLYLQGQIPRAAVEQANRAAYSPPPSASLAITTSSSSAEGTLAEEGGSAGKSNSNNPHLHPTYVLGIEACDSGAPGKLCSRFPNLQIQLRVPSEYNSLGAGGAGYPDGYLDGIGDRLGGARLAGSEGWLTSSGTSRNSLVEQVIIGMTVFFAIVVLVGLLVVFLMRNSRHNGINGNNGCCQRFLLPSSLTKQRDEAAEKIKQTPSGIVVARSRPEVEMLKQERILNPFRINECTTPSQNRVFITEPIWSETGTLGDCGIGGGGLMFDGRRMPLAMAGNLTFSPVPQGASSGMPEPGTMYQTGNNQGLTAFHHPSVGYGVLGPTSIINNNSRPSMPNIPLRSTGHRPDEYQTLDPVVSMAVSYGMPRACEPYYQSSRRLDKGSQKHLPLQNEPPMEFEKEEVRRGSGDSLEFIKGPFRSEDDAELGSSLSDPPKIINSTSTLGRSRTFNFPKATFV